MRCPSLELGCLTAAGLKPAASANSANIAFLAQPRRATGNFRPGLCARRGCVEGGAPGRPRSCMSISTHPSLSRARLPIPPPAQRIHVVVPAAGLDPARRLRNSTFSRWRVYRFHHAGMILRCRLRLSVRRLDHPVGPMRGLGCSLGPTSCSIPWDLVSSENFEISTLRL